MFDDIASVSLRSALDGLAARQKATSENIANIQTPNYRAVRVGFEESLKQAVEDGNPGAVAPSRSTSLEPTREDGNNVNLDTETLSSVDTNLRYQLALRAMDHEYSLIRTSLRTNG